MLAFATATPSAQDSNPCDHVTRNVWDPRFTPGQRWGYRSRPVDAGSTLVITRIDDVPEIGPVVQIEVNHVNFFDRPPTPRGNSTGTQHLAIRRASLDASVLEMLGIVALSDDSSSYIRWHMNCIGLTYSTTVADTLTALQAEYCVETAKRKSGPVPACPPGPNPSIPPAPYHMSSPSASSPPAPAADSPPITPIAPKPQPPD